MFKKSLSAQVLSASIIAVKLTDELKEKFDNAEYVIMVDIYTLVAVPDYALHLLEAIQKYLNQNFDKFDINSVVFKKKPIPLLLLYV